VCNTMDHPSVEQEGCRADCRGYLGSIGGGYMRSVLNFTFLVCQRRCSVPYPLPCPLRESDLAVTVPSKERFAGSGWRVID